MNILLRTLFAVLLLTGLALCLAPGNPDTGSVVKKGEWESIFNGKDLSGWQMKITGYELNDNYAHTFQVKDGKLIVSYDEYDTFHNAFGHIFYKEKLSDYRLRLEYRFVGEQVAGGPEWGYRNSGIKFHAPPPELIPKDQTLLVAPEMQLLGGNGVDERPTGNICTAGTHVVMNGKLHTQHCTNSSSPTFHGDQWVQAELEVHGNGKVLHRINGVVVMEYEQPQLDDSDEFARELMAKGFPRMLSEGYIALQAESHPIDFRNIELLDLCGCKDPDAKNYKSYYAKDLPESCIY